MFGSVKLALETIRNQGFLGFLIFGRKRLGKSVYAMKSLYQLLRKTTRMSVEECWREVLKRIAFLPHEATDFLRRNVNYWIWDDAGVWFSTYKWFNPEYRRWLEEFLDYWDTIGTDCNIIFFTTPTKLKLPPRIREDPSIINVKIVKRGSREYDGKIWKVACARGYRKSESIIDNKVYAENIFNDVYTVKLPDWVWEAYYPRRKMYAEIAKQQLLKRTEQLFSKPEIPLKELIKYI